MPSEESELAYLEDQVLLQFFLLGGGGRDPPFEYLLLTHYTSLIVVCYV